MLAVVAGGAVLYLLAALLTLRLVEKYQPNQLRTVNEKGEVTPESDFDLPMVFFTFALWWIVWIAALWRAFLRTPDAIARQLTRLLP